VREARRGDPARLLRRFASRDDSLKITGDWYQSREFSFPLPPLEEQSEIVTVMKAANANLPALLQKEKTVE